MRISLWHRLVQKGNPMFWPGVDRALLACALTIVLNLFFLSTGLVAQAAPTRFPYVQHDVLPRVNSFIFGVILLWGSLFLIFMRLRRHSINHKLPGLIVTYLFGHPLVVLAYFNGVHTLVTGLLLAVTPAFGFVMFQNRHVVIAMLLIWAEIILLGLAVSFGLLVDAPLYGDPPPNRVLAPSWLFMQVLIGFPASIGILMFTQYIVNALRDRESEVRELSRRDALTGVWNRGYLNELLERESALAERNGQPLSLVVVDLDFFKKINDNHGHAAGDQSLRLAANSLADSIREVDHLGRFGGEEFLLLLPNCDLRSARAIAERCRAALAAVKVNTGGETFSISASFGVASSAGAKIDTELLFRRADSALYSAKDGGRNQVALA